MPSLPNCDIIMKGGITSGVVYPHAVLELSRKHRFRNIGGTSAGAIAAALTAAAEYNRAHGGFEELEAATGRIGRSLFGLFQPAAPFSGLFAVEEAARLLSADFPNYTPGPPDVMMAAVTEFTDIDAVIARRQG